MTTEPMQTHTLPEYGLSFTANKKYKTIINKISHFAKIKKLSETDIQQALKNAYNNIKTSNNQTKTARQILTNIDENQGTYSDLNDLLFTRQSEVSSTSTETKKTKGKEQAKVESERSHSDTASNVFTAMRDDEGQTYDTMDIEEEGSSLGVVPHTEQPKLNESQLKHIKEVVEIMEKEPKLKADIKRTIVEELAKGYINPEQFKRYSQELDNLNTKQETPQTIRAKKTPKPRAKKSQQADIPIIPMDIGTSSKIPKGKSKKDNQKKKTKIVTL